MAAKKLETKSVILTQTKIIVGFYCLLLFGLTFLFYQNYQNSKKLLIINYFDQLNQHATLLNNSISNISEHVSMLKSAFESETITSQNFSLIKKQLASFSDITTYHPKKDYYSYNLGEWLGHHQVLSTVYASGEKVTGSAVYDQLILKVFKMQTIQVSYLKSHSDIVLSYYLSEKNSFSQAYPAIQIAKMIEPFDSGAEFISHVFDTYREKVSRERNPKLESFWTAPYQDPAGHGLMVTCAVPVENGTGIIGADVVLKFLTQFTHHLKILGKAAILTNENIVIAATDFNYENNGELVSFGDGLQVNHPSDPDPEREHLSPLMVTTFILLFR